MCRLWEYEKAQLLCFSLARCTTFFLVIYSASRHFWSFAILIFKNIARMIRCIPCDLSSLALPLICFNCHYYMQLSSVQKWISVFNVGMPIVIVCDTFRISWWIQSHDNSIFLEVILCGRICWREDIHIWSCAHIRWGCQPSQLLPARRGCPVHRVICLCRYCHHEQRWWYCSKGMGLASQLKIFIVLCYLCVGETIGAKTYIGTHLIAYSSIGDAVGCSNN